MVIYEQQWSDVLEPVYPSGWPKPKQFDPVDLQKPELVYPVDLPTPGGLYPMDLPTAGELYPVDLSTLEPVYPVDLPTPGGLYPVDLPTPGGVYPVDLPTPGGLYPVNLSTLDPVYLDLLKPRTKWDRWPWTGCETVHDPLSHFLSAGNHISIKLRFTEGVTTPYRLKMRVVQLNATLDRNHAHPPTPSTQPFIPGRLAGLEGRLVTPSLGRRRQ